MLQHHIDMHKKSSLFKICIPYNSKSSLMSKCLGTNDVIVKRAHCICNESLIHISCTTF